MIRDEQSVTNTVAAIWVLLGTTVIMVLGFQAFRGREIPSDQSRRFASQTQYSSRESRDPAKIPPDENSPSDPRLLAAEEHVESGRIESPVLLPQPERRSPSSVVPTSATAESRRIPLPLSKDVPYTPIEMAPPAEPIRTPPPPKSRSVVLSAPSSTMENSQEPEVDAKTSEVAGQPRFQPFFGVGMRDSSISRITTLYSNSTATLLGIRLGDVLLAFNGERITNLEDLRKILPGLRVGESVHVTVRRNGATLELGPVPLQEKH